MSPQDPSDFVLARKSWLAMFAEEHGPRLRALSRDMAAVSERSEDLWSRDALEGIREQAARRNADAAVFRATLERARELLVAGNSAQALDLIQAILDHPNSKRRP